MLFQVLRILIFMANHFSHGFKVFIVGCKSGPLEHLCTIRVYCWTVITLPGPLAERGFLVTPLQVSDALTQQGHLCGPVPCRSFSSHCPDSRGQVFLPLEPVLGSKVPLGHSGVTSQAYCSDVEVPLFLASEVSHLFLLGSSLM